MNTAAAALVGVIIPTLILILVGAVVVALIICLLLDLYGMWKYYCIMNCPEKKLLSEMRRIRKDREITKKFNKVYNDV